MNATFTLLVTSTILAGTIQSNVADYIQGYKVSKNYTASPIGGAKANIDPSQCLIECSVNPKCRAIALTFPTGFDVSHQGGGSNSTCYWYGENIPFSQLDGPFNSPYYSTAGEWVAVLNLRADDSVPSVQGLPANIGTCDANAGGCFFTCAAGSSSALSATGSQCQKCKPTTWAEARNSLTSCEACAATNCSSTTGIAIEPQISCNSGFGLYNGSATACPLGTWSRDLVDSNCNYCAGRECDSTGAVTKCATNTMTCDAAGNAKTCAQNYYLDGSNGCSRCDYGSTSPDSNTFTYSTCSQVSNQPVAELYPVVIRTIPFSDGTYSGDSKSGNSTSCYAGSELVIALSGSRQHCMPCEENMQQSLDGSTLRCTSCSIGMDTCSSTGNAISCSADWFLRRGSSATCVQCSGLTSTTSAGNKESQCSPTIESSICAVGSSLNKRGISVRCALGKSSPGGLVNECMSCGLGARECSISDVGIITIKKCFSSYKLNNGACDPLYCGPGLFLINGFCASCAGASTSPDQNRLPKCLLCSVGSSSCNSQGVNTCSAGYYLSGGKCNPSNSYDFIQGYQANLKINNRLQNNKTLTPKDCLALCENTSFCRAISVKTNGPILPGVCNLFSDVIAKAEMITITGVQPYTNAQNVAGAPFYAILNRRNRKSDKPSIDGLPATAGVCSAGSEGCFTTCGIGSTAGGNLLGGNCIPCANPKGIPAQNTLLQCPDITAKLMKRTSCH